MITASALRRNCGFPRVLDNLPPRTAKERENRAKRDAAAVLGTAFHAAVEAWKLTGELPQPADDEVRGWLDMLAATGWRPWAFSLLEVAMGLRADGTGVMCDEPEPHVYVARDGSEIVTAGRADVVTPEVYSGLVFVIRDWKTGRYHVDPPERNLQLASSGLAACSIGRADGFRREVYYAREGALYKEEDPIMVGTPAYARVLDEVLTAARLDNEPRPGEHCRDCWDRRMKRCDKAQTTFASETD